VHFLDLPISAIFGYVWFYFWKRLFYYRFSNDAKTMKNHTINYKSKDNMKHRWYVSHRISSRWPFPKRNERENIMYTHKPKWSHKEM